MISLQYAPLCSAEKNSRQLRRFGSNAYAPFAPAIEADFVPMSYLQMKEKQVRPEPALQR